MTTLEKIDLVVERERDADIDALCDAALLPFQVVEPEPDVYGLATALADLRQNYNLPHIITWSKGYSGRANIHVDADWFDAEFAGNPNIVIEPHAKLGGIKKSIEYEGVDIYCWQNAEFRMVAA